MSEHVSPRPNAKVQTHPVIISTWSGQAHKVFIDSVVCFGNRIAVLGWATCPQLELSLDPDDDQDAPEALTRHDRDDVGRALGLTSGAGLGFSAILVRAPDLVDIELSICLPRAERYQTGPLAEKSALSEAEIGLLPLTPADGLEMLGDLEVGSDAWRTILRALPEADTAPDGFHGHIENAFFSPEGGGVVFGWAVHPPGALIWLEDEDGDFYPLDAMFRRGRKDIASAFSQSPWRHFDSAFIGHLPALAIGATIRLRTATAAGVFTLHRQEGGDLLPADPKLAAERLFSLETEEQLFHARASLVDWPLLTPLIARKLGEISRITPVVTDFGTPPEAPGVSIIVPLYKRFDFIEHQVLEFLRDPELLAQSELIYVIDDPTIRQDVLDEANRLHRLCGIPFRVIHGRCNRGFSGASNLGARYARGQYLLFLNSDVIPIEPGWLAPLAATLADDTVGAVGAQLMFPDGGIQHVGMDFRKYEPWAIWANYHPGMGIQPPDEVAEHDVPAITGACLMIARPVFDQIGGWDCGYLIGDFEDSDLCLALRSRGYRIVCNSAARLTHLERQSFTGVGADAFRHRMTICNAVRHHQRWPDLIEGRNHDGRPGAAMEIGR